MNRLLPAVIVSLLLPSAAAAQTPTPTPPPAPVEPRIVPGVLAGGIDVSNLTVAEATVKIANTASPPLSADLVVAVAGDRRTLRMRRINLRLDAERSAKRALYRGRAAPPVAPATLNVPLAIRFRRNEVREFVTVVHRNAYIAPRDATARITLRHIRVKRARVGRQVDVAALTASIEATLVDPLASRLLLPGRVKLRPTVNANDLPRLYRTVVTIDRSTFTLRLFKRMKLAKRYRVAVGAPGFDTPAGLFSISNKAVNPAWSAPNKPWAGAYANEVVAGGAPDNPLKARWLGIVDGVGIHGTGMPWSIGTRASHGCIRMTVPDVIDLYPRVPVGAPVLIG